ncbi:hypothetical protein TELCIR_17223 [Teladorsagia circumcincta]|uniref:SCP domain-containing protein n=1 Tax=Teladorsagia circumcincta TaxID=45464 RepID=A0A2G9TUY9_TELCI|nr:hypothetical protein TELCIR_17223 [Teladorsagia circumcincta]
MRWLSAIRDALQAALSSIAEAGFCCSKTPGQTDNARQIFLDFHNDIRRNIALGKSLVNFRTGQIVLGPAKNMYKLVRHHLFSFSKGKLPWKRISALDILSRKMQKPETKFEYKSYNKNKT